MLSLLRELSDEREAREARGELETVESQIQEEAQEEAKEDKDG
jgi:hypothetical protein